tara:strand:+ start:257 stop:418 length:162 start_codon:yes stop_codon:yes gene_type:complete
MRVGNLVKTVRNHIGVVIDTAVEWNGEKQCLVLFAHSGKIYWWAKNDLEVICK